MMLEISEAQLERCGQFAAQDFEEQMVEHCTEFSPKLAKVLGRDQLHVAVRSSLERAAGYGFTFRGPARLFTELCLLFGSRFDVDVQYPWAADFLARSQPSTQMQVAEALHQRAVDALDAIHGPDNHNTYLALERLLRFSERDPGLRSNTWVEQILAALAQIHPQKYAYIGQSAAADVIDRARAATSEHGVHGPEPVLLFAVLMFSFGQGCTEDPLYPWIAGTLANPRVPDPERRVYRLRQKALTWLRHVLENRAEPHDR